MEDRDFLDHIYQIWSKTTGADDRFWMPKQLAGPGSNRIVAVADDHSEKLVASLVSDEDADFITAVHGCFADLIRKLQDSLDEADRLDEEKDELICRIGVLEQEADQANAEIIANYKKIDQLQEALGH